PESVALAVRELTGDASLADITEQIEIYRRLGLRSRVQDLVDASADARTAALEKVHTTAPEEEELLRERLIGIAPSFEHGVPRRDNFLTTIFTAADQNNLDLMALEDVQELLVLVFELLSGRQISQLVIEYEGNWQQVRSLDEVESARSRYSVSQAMAMSRLYALASKLSERPELGFDESLADLSTEELLAHLTSGLEQLVQARQVDAANSDYLRNLLELVRETLRAGEELQKRRERYARALERWEELRQRQPVSDHPFKLMRRSRGMRIREQKIGLEDDQKIELARNFCKYMREAGYRTQADGLSRQGRPLNSKDLKQLAIRLSLKLQPYVQISDASIQRAIYSSRAAFIGGLEIGFSADAKAGLGAAAVSEVHEDLAKAAEYLALRIRRVYQLPLSESMIDFLVEQYNASRDRLNIIAETPLDGIPYSNQFAATMVRLTMDSEHWRRTIMQLEQLLQNYDRRRSIRSSA
ncbi:MAG: hypothetical protein PVF21_04420, partial [Thiohalophilus sp.]